MAKQNNATLLLETLRRNNPDGKRSQKKTPEPPSLIPLERDYRTRIFKMLDPALAIIKEIVFPVLPDLIEAAKQEGLRIDATGDNIERVFDLVRIRFASIFDDGRLDRDIDGVARRVSRANQATISRQFQTVLAIDPTQAEPWLGPMMELHNAQNSSLIKTLPNEALPDIEQMVMRATRSGESASSVQRQILERWDITEGRAKVIARDQISKLNSSLNAQRQQRAGVTKYKWKDVDDERVRRSHELRDGHIFEWGKPIKPQLVEKGLPVDNIDGHPGEPIMCRCQPIPVFD